LLNIRNELWPQVHIPKMFMFESPALQCEESMNWDLYEQKLFQCRSICCSAGL